MPAVSLAQLKIHIDQLAWQFTRPADFQRSLRNLLEGYGDRVYRAGQTLQSRTNVQAYHVPVLLTRQIEISLSQLTLQNPAAALALADQLWSDPYLEPRLMGAHILGQLPIEMSLEVLSRLKKWSARSEKRQVLSRLFEKGTFRLRREKPELLLNMLQDWVGSPSDRQQALALQALQPVIRDYEVENLPAVIQIIHPLLTPLQIHLQNDLLDVITALAGRSETETSYYLRQVIRLNPEPNIVRLLRRALPSFPPGMQDSLRQVLKETYVDPRGKD